MNKSFSHPTSEAKQEALNHPNGYVYVINPDSKGKEEVPPEEIIGAWKVDENGLIKGPFISNPNFKGNLS